MTDYHESKIRTEHAIRLLRAVKGMHQNKDSYRRSLELCLSRLGNIYRDFDSKNIDVEGMCRLSGEIWNERAAEEKLSLLSYLMAMQGLQDELDCFVISDETHSHRRRHANIA